MAHNGSGAPRLRQDPGTDELVLVRGWLTRCLPAAAAEDLSVDVLAAAAAAGPACVATAPREIRLRYLSVQAVLRARGVL